MKGESRYKAASLVALPANATMIASPLELVTIVPPEMPAVTSYGLTLFASYDAYAPLIRLQDYLQDRGRSFVDVEASVSIDGPVNQGWMSEDGYGTVSVLKAQRLRVEAAESLEAEYRAFLRKNRKRAEPRPEGLPHSLLQWVWQPQFFPEFIASHPELPKVRAVYYEVLSDKAAIVNSEGRPFVKLATLLTVLDPTVLVEAWAPLLPGDIKVVPVFGESSLKGFSAPSKKSA